MRKGLAIILTSLGMLPSAALTQNAVTVTGSGVVIGDRGDILTNSHVVEDCKNITVQISSEKAQPAILVARDQLNDLAIVRVNSSPASVAAFRGSAPLRAGDSIVALGYPLSGLLATTANLSVGIVSALAGLGNDARYIQISAPVQPGNSGGPLLDTSGHVVGIVTAKLNAVRVARFTGDIPQNVNFAIKAEVARAFLESKDIVYRTVRSDQQLSTADVGDIARLFTAYIECLQPTSQSASVTSAKPSKGDTTQPASPPQAAVMPPIRPSTGETPHQGRSFRDCADCPEMVVLPSGRFIMGTEASERGSAPNERPRHAVLVNAAFAVGKYHVTRGEYARFVQASGYTGEKDGCAGDWPTTKSWHDPGFPQSDRDPVVCVDWYDAKAYSAWLSATTGKSYRLLTEAEWEYAARAGTTTARWWGDDIGRGHANCYGCVSQWEGKRWTSPVGSFAPNLFGIHDMLGNAFQWVEDCFLRSYAAASNDASVARKSEDCSNRVVRGGGWSSDTTALRSSYRWSFYASYRVFSTGFRVARPL